MGSNESRIGVAHQLRRLIKLPRHRTRLARRTEATMETVGKFSRPQHAPYAGLPNPELGAPFIISEIETVVRNLTRNTTPGKDPITNKYLRNLAIPALEAVLEYINSQWQAGTLPALWRHAHITLIPKPNKPLTSGNLRPISLTSCAGKLYEHLIHNRLSAT